MEKLLEYIANDVTILKQDVGVAASLFKKQNKINRSLILVLIGGSIYIYLNESQRKELAKQVECLTKEVGALKKLKGE